MRPTWPGEVCSRGGVLAVVAGGVLIALWVYLHQWMLSSVSMSATPLRLPLKAHALLASGRGQEAANSALQVDARPRLLVLIVSSYQFESVARRKTVRETWLQFEDPNVVVEHRFVLGAPRLSMGLLTLASIRSENEEHGDLVFVPAEDTYNNLSRKVWLSLQLAALIDADYVVKTDDDCYVRLDTIMRELPHWPRQRFWSGLVNRYIPPIRDKHNKNNDLAYPNAYFPPFTAGAMHILSADLVSRLAMNPQQPVFLPRNEDQALGLWLFSLLTDEPVHDRRIQQWHVCEDDMLVKHFYRNFSDPPMERMHDNVVSGRSMCDGFLQHYCAVCYSCQGRQTNYTDWGFGCDPALGMYIL